MHNFIGVSIGGREIDIKKRHGSPFVNERKLLYESLGITQTTNQSHYGQCLKESIEDHYE
jgi:hypothetical protein